MDSSSEFPVAHDVGLNYFNDITVGVISNSSNNIKIITAAGTRSYVFTGTSLSNINQVTEIASPQENTFYSNYVGLGQLIKDSNNTIYKFDHNVMDSEALKIDTETINVKEIGPTISLDLENKYADMCTD